MLLAPLMTPILGTEGMGALYTAIGVFTILLTVSRFGLGILLTREVTRAKELTWPLFWSTIRIRWMISAAT